MEFISGMNRWQYFTGCLDDSVDESNPVRFIDAYVSQLDMARLGFRNSEPQETGRPAYSPQDLLKLYIYGYFNRVRSSRKLEKESYRNIEVMWLINNLHPDHKTIARFRQKNPEALKNVFRDFVRLCMELDLYGRELIAIDGSKFKAWNSKDRNFTKGKLDYRIRRIDEKIAAYMEELDREDAGTDAQEGAVEKSNRLQEAIAALNDRRAVLEGYKSSITGGEETQISLTDPDSRLMKTKNGMDICLNVQTAVDSKNKLVVEFTVGNQAQDKNMMAPMAEAASAALGTDGMTIVADNGYDSISDVAQVLAGGNVPVVCGGDYEFWYPASEEDAEIPTDYDIEIARPVYLPERNVFVCPMGQFLIPSCYVKSKHIAKYGNTGACAKCPKKCTVSRYHYTERRINKSEFSKTCDATPTPLRRIRILQNKEIASQRKAIVEHPFGIIKRGLGIEYLLLRTIARAEGELSLAFLAFNMKRALNILGIQKMMAGITR